MNYIACSPAAARGHALRLAGIGLVSLPRWGGGKALPGTDHRAVADQLLSRAAVAAGDFSGGLAILGGTAHPTGGYVTLVDIDDGPLEPPPPADALLVEAGTAAGKWHALLRTGDRLDGQVILRDSAGAIAAEIKGVGCALRSWPTLPPDKPRGYRIVYMARSMPKTPPSITVTEVVESLAAMLTRVLGREVNASSSVERKGLPRVQHRGQGPPWLPLVFDSIVAHLETVGARPRPTRDGGIQALCPFHKDRSPSLTLHPVKGWRCWAGCGEGKLVLLAARLGVRVPEGEPW